MRMYSQAKLIFNGRIHSVGKNYIYAAKGFKVYRSKDFGNTWKLFFSLPVSPSEKILGSNKILRRLLRTGIHHINCINNDRIILCLKHKIFQYSIAKNQFIFSKPIMSGSRPLFLCHDNNGTAYFGQYCNNPQRTPVHIFANTRFGEDWKIVHTFSSIRHIHGVFYDPYENAIWATTGDRDMESAIWRTKDHFQSIEKIVSGSQQTRALQLLFTSKYVYFGSDTPLEKNYIYRLDRTTYQIEKLHPVNGSIFWGCKVNENLFFSTAVEPSKINKCNKAQLWASPNGKIWQCISQFQKDKLPPKLFQYGQILFPTGENNSKYLWFTPFATTYDQKTFRLNIKKLPIYFSNSNT